MTALFSLLSCNVYKKEKFTYRNDDEKVWINTFKTEVFYSCINEGFGNDSIIRVLKSKDLLNIYDGFPTNEIDKARVIGKKIISDMPKPYIKIDNDESHLKNKNFISYSCLNYYASRELDSIAKKAYKTYLKNQKNENF
jgi:hypothetical protein